MDDNVKDGKESTQDDLSKNTNLSIKVFVINNLLSILINCSVIITVVAAIVVIDALFGVGMGLEFFAVPIASAAYIYLGYKLLTPTSKYLWASVVGSAMLVIAAAVLLHVQTLLPLAELLLIGLFAALVPAFLMYMGLRMRVKDDNKRQTIR